MISAFDIAIEQASVFSQIITTASLDCDASLACKKIRVSASSWLHLKYNTSLTFSVVTLRHS